MVVDDLTNFESYVALNPLFPEVLAFIRTHDLRTLPEGKLLLKGDDLWVNVQTVRGKTADEAVFETHRRMLDIQIPLDHTESYGYRPLSSLPETPYDPVKDVTKYPGVKAESLVTCRPGEFAVFWPRDGHQPCIGEGEIRKAIFKVRVSF